MRRPWLVLLLVCSAQFMVTLDVTVANVALPSIGRDLGIAVGDLQWVITPYVLLTGGLMLLGGRAADLLGRRPVFLTGLGLFTAASLASGLAWAPGALIASRALQGAGAALLLPSAMSILTTTYDGPQRARALATWGAIASAGAALGMLIGGLLTQLVGWPAIFLVNVPVGLTTLVLGARAIPAGARGAGTMRELDARGGLALIAGLVVALYTISRADVEGWGSAWTLGGLAGGAFLLGGFALAERRARRPLVPPVLWRRRSLVAGTVVMLGATGVIVGSFFLNTLYLQGVLGDDPLEAGVAFLPLALAILAAAHVGQRLIGRVGARPVLVGGLLLMALGALLLAVVPDHAGYARDLLPGYLLLGLGAGLSFVSVSIASMADVGPAEAGGAAGLMTTGHEIGAALGVAVLSAVATSAADLAGGYRTGYAVVVGVAVVLAAAAGVLMPVVRPAAGHRMAMH